MPTPRNIVEVVGFCNGSPNGTLKVCCHGITEKLFVHFSACLSNFRSGQQRTRHPCDRAARLSVNHLRAVFCDSSAKIVRQPDMVFLAAPIRRRAVLYVTRCGSDSFGHIHPSSYLYPFILRDTHFNEVSKSAALVTRANRSCLQSQRDSELLRVTELEQRRVHFCLGVANG